MTQVAYVPEGYTTLTPYLIVADGPAAIAFYQSVFGAQPVMRLDRPDGKVGHAELRIGTALLMLADACPEAAAPGGAGESGVGLVLYVEDVDAVAARAVDAGATLKRPVETMFYGDRMGTLVDPFGHTWHVATHVEDVPVDELQRRAAAAMAPG